jgi:hypothetical protein
LLGEKILATSWTAHIFTFDNYCELSRHIRSPL